MVVQAWILEQSISITTIATSRGCLHQSTAASTWWCGPQLGLGRNGCWPSRGSQLPRALPFIFSLCFPLNDRKRAAHSFFKIGRLFSLFLFSCLSLALLGLLILLLFLMSGNVYPNPGPIFPCSVCAGNVTWRAVMGFRGFARVRANPFLECHDNQRTRSCFLL